MIINGKKTLEIIRNGSSISEVLRNNEILYTKEHLIARYSAKGKTNSDADRGVLKDLSGNGYDVELKNFAFGGMSGYNGFTINFLSWKANTGIDRTDSRIIIPKGSTAWLLTTDVSNTTIPSYKVKITGDVTGLSYFHFLNGGRVSVALKEGENVIPEDIRPASGVNSGFNISGTTNTGCVIEQIPLYPDSLVFDGVDDYGIVNTIRRPVLTRIIKGYVIVNGLTQYSYDTIGTKPRQYAHIINGPSYFTERGSRNLINGIQIVTGDYEGFDTLLLGTRFSYQEYGKLVFNSMLLYDKILTLEEIQAEILKYNL